MHVDSKWLHYVRKCYQQNSSLSGMFSVPAGVMGNHSEKLPQAASNYDTTQLELTSLDYNIVHC